mgnify:CR=1 FL=1
MSRLISSSSVQSSASTVESPDRKRETEKNATFFNFLYNLMEKKGRDEKTPGWKVMHGVFKHVIRQENQSEIVYLVSATIFGSEDEFKLPFNNVWVNSGDNEDTFLFKNNSEDNAIIKALKQNHFEVPTFLFQIKRTIPVNKLTMRNYRTEWVREKREVTFFVSKMKNLGQEFNVPEFYHPKEFLKTRPELFLQGNHGINFMLNNCKNIINFAATEIRGKHYVIQDIKLANLVCNGNEMHFIDVDRNNIEVLEDGMPNWSTYVYLRQRYPDWFREEDEYDISRNSMSQNSGKMQMLFELLLVSVMLAKFDYMIGVTRAKMGIYPNPDILNERVLIVPNAIIDVVASEATPEKKAEFLSYFKEENGHRFLMYILMGYKYDDKKDYFVREPVSNWHLENNILLKSGCVFISHTLFSSIHDVVKQKRNDNRPKNREAKKAMEETGSAAKRQRREFLGRMFKSKLSFF